MKRIGLFVGLFLLITYLGICTSIYFTQERMIFPATKLPENYKLTLPTTAKEVTIPVDGADLDAVLFVPNTAPKGLVVYFHGNGGTLERWAKISNRFTDRGYAVFMSDYRGYGKSTGKILNEKQVFDDAQAVFAFAKKLLPESKLILWGRSLGSGIAAEVASNNVVDKLVLETPYYNLAEVSKLRMPYLPTGLLLKYPIMTSEFVKQVKCPIYMVHGTADRVIPYSQAEHLAKDTKATFVTVPNADHKLDDFMEMEQFYSQVLN